MFGLMYPRRVKSLLAIGLLTSFALLGIESYADRASAGHGYVEASGQSEEPVMQRGTDQPPVMKGEGHGDGHRHDHQHPKHEIQHGTGPSTDPDFPFDHHGKPIREDPTHQKVVQGDVAVEMTVENFLGVGGRGGEIGPEIFAGEHALLKFRISAAESGVGIPNLRPRVWMDLQQTNIAGGEDDGRSCKAKIGSYLSGTLTNQADINFNSYFVLAMNKGSTISVINPMINVAGMTNLYAVMDLSGPGSDWIMMSGQERLFITSASAGKVDIADLESFRVIKRLDAGDKPNRVALQPDQRYLWVGNDSDQLGESGVTVIDTETLTDVARIPTGSGHHEMAFSRDGSHIFVTNGSAETLSIIDTKTREKVTDLKAGHWPVAVAVSELNDDIYVADAGQGLIFVFDGDTFDKIAEIKTDLGLAGLRFAPGGKWGLATSQMKDKLFIFDAKTNRVNYVVPIPGQPDEISFSGAAAYIRAKGSPAVVAIPLSNLDEPGEALPVVTLSAGRRAPGAFSAQAEANSVFANENENALLIANPADDQIYYLAEGTQAPLGSFQGHTLFPRAVLVVDRSIREVAPAIYTGRLRVPSSGTYDVAFLLDSPKVLHCFEFTAKANPKLSEPEAVSRVEFSLVDKPGKILAGERVRLRFNLLDSVTKAPLSDLRSVHALTRQAAGNWHQRYAAKSLGDGLYEVSLLVPRAGFYNLFFAVPALNVRYDQLPIFHLTATADHMAN
jgi:YVTN family beta-propeller protein